MKALYYVGEKSMEMRDIPVPTAGPGRYLVKVRANGICGSDVEGYLGKTGRRLAPMIMGHEVAGVIAEAPAAAKHAVGTRVVIFPKPFCGECEFCKKGMVNVCPSGICMGVLDQDGSMTEFVAVEEKYLIPFADTLSFSEAAMTEPLAVAYRSVQKLSDQEIAEAAHCLVIGAGTIGLLVVALLKLRGAKHVIVADATDFRLGVARTMGADATINSRAGDFIEAVKTLTDGRLCDFSIEAVGIGATAANSLDCLRIGGTAVWIGNAQKLVEVNMQKIVTTELTIKGNYVYDFAGFEASLKLLEQGRIDVSPLMTNVYPLADGVQAFRDLENNREGKMLKVFLENA
ncbi:zinc-dependent alcohol dehydrogenase [Propionivibrio dicarboxylicus]|uniref:L-iditol 2-dehydrogenase n=1 Tax=Propionivibrio dicarboxylicus TaxID=83767 RepID=A0A1G8NHN8_9RHOO|nr:zinc-binding dehydrogenase [Propionivibrio dicarboxylicus]SDI79678.1 L-iditol 2-dehydrogenase [Propionivibrio dicarboxylicus]